MKVYNSRSKGKSFIRVCLHSGTANSPLGDEEVAVFCRCDDKAPSKRVYVDIKGLLKWANSNPAFAKNQSNDRFRVSKQEGAIALVYLSEREISCCERAGRIYPRLAAGM
jgi:hypothetical protein